MMARFSVGCHHIDHISVSWKFDIRQNSLWVRIFNLMRDMKRQKKDFYKEMEAGLFLGKMDTIYL